MDPNAVDMSAEMQAQIDAQRATQEGTASAESAPAEPNIESQTPPVGELTQPDQGHVKSVPLENFIPVREKAKELERENAWLREQIQQSQTPPPQGYNAAPPMPGNSIPQLDPEVVPAVRQVAWQVLEEQRASEFLTRHAQELSNPVLRGSISAIIQDANARGQVISQEDALTQAKQLIAQQAQPHVEQAQSQAFAEGQDLARAKNRAGAVGDTVKAAPPPDVDKMSAAEFRQYMNIPRYTG